MDEATLRRLYAIVPTEFVAARNEVVKELRRAKQRDEATAVAALRRPDWTDWALNVAAAERTETVEEFARAAGDVRDAQSAAIEGRAGPDVRAALRALRERTADVIRASSAALEGAGRPSGTAELTARLSEIAGSSLTIDQLRMGVLGSSDPDVSDPFGGFEPAARPSSRRQASGKRGATAARPESKPRRGSTSKEEPKDTPKEEAEEERQPSAAERQRIRRERELAERAHKAAVRELGRAEDDLEQATAAVATARQKLVDAERRQAEATERRQAAAEQVTQAAAARSALNPIS